MEIQLCNKCGFILHTRPGLRQIDGVCLACINADKKKTINFSERQKWLDMFLEQNKAQDKYDCLIAVSGGKDSHMIVKRLVDNHNVKNPLLVTVADDYSLSEAGAHNRKNISEFFGFDHIVFRNNPKKFREVSLKDFVERLNPQRWYEETLYDVPIELARKFNVKTVFFGENSSFEYGNSESLEIFHPRSTEELNIIFMGSIYPYSITDSIAVAKEANFKDLADFDTWFREGSIEDSTQIDSIGNMVDIWCKFPKFGFQRVSDIACRLVREGILNKEQALRLIREKDHILDRKAKRDFCKVQNISEDFFDKTVLKHVNRQLIYTDINGYYRRVDCI